MSVNDWLNDKLADIATRLPSLVHEDPASFACGYNAGYKQAMLDLEREMRSKEVDEDMI